MLFVVFRGAISGPVVHCVVGGESSCVILSASKVQAAERLLSNLTWRASCEVRSLLSTYIQQ